MKIIAFANQKGGVGKTTTAVTLAHGLARLGRRTLLVDLDPQGHTAYSLGLAWPTDWRAWAAAPCWLTWIRRATPPIRSDWKRLPGCTV